MIYLLTRLKVTLIMALLTGMEALPKVLSAAVAMIKMCDLLHILPNQRKFNCKKLNCYLFILFSETPHIRVIDPTQNYLLLAGECRLV